MAADLSDRHRAPEQTHWIPLADLMTGLMMVFLLIAITYMVKVEAASQHIREIAVLYERMKVELYDDLKSVAARSHYRKRAIFVEDYQETR